MKDNLIFNEQIVTIEELQTKPHARILNLTDIIPILISPDSGNSLQIAEDYSFLFDSSYSYPIIKGVPVVYPEYISKALIQGGLALKYYDDPRIQYFLLSQIKQRGEINAASSNIHYQRHLFRMTEFVKDCKGLILDIGCDDVNIGSAIFSRKCEYIGLDPFAKSNDFRIIGIGEFLPFKDSCVDNVLFNTSLDHILDYYQAVKESFRVLKEGGLIIISTLLWSHDATLLKDSVHFHHFKSYEIYGVLNEFGFKVEDTKKFVYKNDGHRYGLYISARKNGSSGFRVYNV